MMPGNRGVGCDIDVLDVDRPAGSVGITSPVLF